MSGWKPFAGSAEAQIGELLDRVHRAWLFERGEALANTLRDCFAEDVVVRGPGFALLGQGLDFAVSTYVNFAAECTLNDVRCEEIEVDLFGDTAVAQYGWTIVFEREGREFTESGHEMLTLMRRDGRWVIVWRTILPD